MRQKKVHSKKAENFSHAHYFLSGILYPISRKSLIEYVRNKGGNTGLLDTLERLSREVYISESDVLADINIAKESASVHEIRIPAAMKISKELPQFEEKSGLLIVAGKQEAVLYYAHKGTISCVDLFKIPKPRYSDREGYFKMRAKDGTIRSGSVTKKSQDDNLERDFASMFKVRLKRIVSNKSYIEVFLFIPDYLKSKIIDSLPVLLRKKIAGYVPGNYFKFKPLDLIKKIVIHRLPEVKMIPKEAKKILDQFNRARAYGSGK